MHSVCLICIGTHALELVCLVFFLHRNTPSTRNRINNSIAVCLRHWSRPFSTTRSVCDTVTSSIRKSCIVSSHCGSIITHMHHVRDTTVHRSIRAHSDSGIAYVDMGQFVSMCVLFFVVVTAEKLHVVRQIDAIPSRKFIPLMYQIASRLSLADAPGISSEQKLFRTNIHDVR
jgi:hypothetical protein